MQRFIELLEAKVKPALVKTVPEAPGELKFFRRHTIKDILASFRQAGNDEMFNGKVVKVFPRKKNHFGNDTVDSIRAYESLNLEEGLKIPKGQIDFIVNKYHVGTPAKEIEDDIRKRATKSKTPWPSSMLNKAVEYAMKQHVKNQDLYGKVMSGDLSSPKKKKVSESVEVNEVLKKNLHKEVKSKKKHIYINGKWVGTSNYDHSNKEALQNYMREHPGTHISKVKVAEESVEVNELSKSLLAKYTISSLANKRSHQKEIDAHKPMGRWDFHDHKVAIKKRGEGIKTAVNKLVKEETPFDKLKNKIKKKEGYSEEGAAGLAAKIGREKLGKKAFQAKAEAGKKANESVKIEEGDFERGLYDPNNTENKNLRSKLGRGLGRWAANVNDGSNKGMNPDAEQAYTAASNPKSLTYKAAKTFAKHIVKPIYNKISSVVVNEVAKDTLKRFADSKGKMKPSEPKDKVKGFIANLRKKAVKEEYEGSALDNKRDKAGMKRTGKTKAEWENSTEDKKTDAKYEKQEKKDK